MSEHHVRSIIEDYFKNLFTSEGPRDWGDILAFVPAVISDDINASLLAPISNEEIRITVFQMVALKSPGPDGFSGIFYQKYWSIVGNDVCRLVKNFFSNTMSMETLNRTEIALIPKVPHPEWVTQFRPISLCNYSYKIISKILANRLQPFLDKFISPQQCAFIPGRQIQDNVLVAHEAFHSLKIRRKTKIFEMGLKLDMSKAYDRIEWDFVQAVLLKMGFARQWVGWVMRCLSSVEFAVIVNGKVGSYFNLTRGLRQGDPLSPYLFLIVSDVLSSMINQAVTHGFIQGMKFGRGGPALSHLFFADDSLMFLKATENNCQVIVRILDSYCTASGQLVNFEK
ncbi:unnamed protein product [Prunus armeniaca]|uniref:Reverse transcriptase domain-containing protein n=1 Tax=Prunus armeniaca TaxID=36596 RepID=A0A6J5VVY5_PRUAR|nr:unnamed protein product [Prunus armeniaca]